MGRTNTYTMITWKNTTSILLIILCCLANRIQSQDSDSLQTKLFDNDEVLDITLSGNIRGLMKDRGNDAGYHNVQLSYKGSAGNMIAVPVKIKTRGNFRRTQGDCTYPPLMLSFSKESPQKESLFSYQDKLKLVTPCQGDKYVVREYLVYKLSNLFTPKSFHARLVRVVYNDTIKVKKSEPLYGMILEPENQMAKRNNMVSVTRRLVRPEQTIPSDFLMMAVFEYLVGNTDWSVQYMQNIKLMASDSLGIPVTVPYDFDHAGIVDAPYALPAEALQMASIKERRYRGYCITDMKRFDEVFARFNQLKPEIYSIYSSCPLLEESYIKSTLKFLDAFYKTINDPTLAKSAFLYPCNKEGTGNVVIKGIRKF